MKGINDSSLYAYNMVSVNIDNINIYVSTAGILDELNVNIYI